MNTIYNCIKICIFENTLEIITSFCPWLGGAYAPEESELTWTWEDPATFNASYIQKFAYTLFNKEALPWYAASNVCASMRARLAQPDSQQKVDFIAELLRSQKQPRAWFGGSPHRSGRTNWPAGTEHS